MTIGGTTNKFLTDGSNPLVEQNGAGDTAATVATPWLDQYLTRTENGSTQVYLTDALGSVIGLANSDGTIATTYTYDPNGTATTTGADSSSPYTFTGRESDDTGLLYYRNRYYDPQTGRFISQDPIGQADGTNLYQYALSSPTTYTDPTGNNPLIAACAINGAIDGGLNWAFQRLSGRKVNWGDVANAALMGCMLGQMGEYLSLVVAARGAGRLPGCNSFTPDTPVLMADGTHKPIKDIKIGDKVQAADPETGAAGTRTVTALIKGQGEEQLVDLVVDTDGSNGTKTGNITATDGHPFWVPDLHQWVQAGDLQPGQWLQTSAGTWVQITPPSTGPGQQRLTTSPLTTSARTMCSRVPLRQFWSTTARRQVAVVAPRFPEGVDGRTVILPKIPDLVDPANGGYGVPRGTRFHSESGTTWRANEAVGEDAQNRATTVSRVPSYAGKAANVADPSGGSVGFLEAISATVAIGVRGGQLLRRWFYGRRG
ncbi:RHS repeat-associated core domain-containing protein [Streptomyces sp. BE230]|uniref:RHS repeat-associated core domain-containing protein n=1 Tax=Streptomyces sp. BE230 TaxID=3002526 RepID=UPI002ED5A997|nr:RHS repeat-associated core domain-containing protein [Streptomyces sp. BE230]